MAKNKDAVAEKPAKGKGKKKDDDIIESAASRKAASGGKKAAKGGGDVLDLTGEEYDTATERKDWGKGGGEPPLGTHKVVIEKSSREVQGGTGDTAGSPLYVLRTKVKGGEHDGRVIFHRAIAHATTGSQILNLAEGLGIDLKTEAKGKGKRIILPSESDAEGWAGMKATVVVTKRSEYQGKTRFNTTLEKADGAKKGKKGKSGLAS